MIDLRSDTMTQPSLAMKEAMCCAPLGDDVWGEDPTINSFQEEVAQLLGKEAALFFPTATQSNLAAILSHCQRGEEYLVGDQAHCYRWEAGGAAVLGSVQPQSIPFETDGTLDLEKVVAHIKPDDPHFAITRLLCIENTQNGQVLPLDYIEKAREVCDRFGLGLHMDGARVFNASVALKVPIRKVVEHIDTVTLCLSKGLGCPTGAVLVGDKTRIKRALRWRKMLGGGMRQAGMLAAAGNFALQHHIENLAIDHANAEKLAKGLSGINDPNLSVDSHATNMVFITMKNFSNGALQSFAKGRGVLLPYGQTMRLVTHRDIQEEDIETVIAVMQEGLSTIPHKTTTNLDYYH